MKKHINVLLQYFQSLVVQQKRWMRWQLTYSMKENMQFKFQYEAHRSTSKPITLIPNTTHLVRIQTRVRLQPLEIPFSLILCMSRKHNNFFVVATASVRISNYISLLPTHWNYLSRPSADPSSVLQASTISSVDILNPPFIRSFIISRSSTFA